MLYYFLPTMRVWSSGMTLPCQGRDRQFESGHPLHQKTQGLIPEFFVY